MILFAETLLGPFHGDFVIAGESLHPVAVIVSALAERFLAHHGDAEDMADEMDHLFGPGEAAEIAMDDDAVEAVVYKNEQAVEQRITPSVAFLDFASATKSALRRNSTKPTFYEGIL